MEEDVVKMLAKIIGLMAAGLVVLLIVEAYRHKSTADAAFEAVIQGNYNGFGALANSGVPGLSSVASSLQSGTTSALVAAQGGFDMPASILWRIESLFGFGPYSPGGTLLPWDQAIINSMNSKAPSPQTSSQPAFQNLGGL